MTSLRVVQVTDCHLQEDPNQHYRGTSSEDRLDRVLSHLVQTKPELDLLLLTGDLVHHGFESGYQRLASKVASIANEVVWLPGNHDDWPRMQLHPALCKPVWSSDSTPWTIVSLRSIYESDGWGVGALGQEQCDWLIEQLDVLQRAGRWVLIALHHPVLDVGSAWQDAIKLADARQLLAIIERAPHVKGVFSGHLHQQHDLSVKGVPFWVTPATASQFKAGTIEPEDELDERLSLPGYRNFTLAEDGSLTTDVIRVEDELET